VKDHEDCFEETNSQGVSYSTGFLAMIGAKLMLKGIWSGDGVFNMEQMDPDPFMNEMNTQGLTWKIKERDV